LSLDEIGAARLVRRQIEGGIDFLVPCGTTGESPTLSRRAPARGRHHARGSQGQGAGAGRRGRLQHAEVIELAKELEALGATACSR
jgi:4-hydroxy-tetrahydrodipicolinate synthase